MRRSNSPNQSEPGRDAEFIAEIYGLFRTGNVVRLANRGGAASIVEDQAKEFDVIPCPSTDSCLTVILREMEAKDSLAATIISGAMIGGGERRVSWRTVVARVVVMIEGRDSENRGGVECVNPGENQKPVRFRLAVAQTGGVELLVFEVVGVGIVGDLIIVPA